MMNSTDPPLSDKGRIASPSDPFISQIGTNELDGRESKNRLPVLDGVRAIACLGVLSYHLNFVARQAGIWNGLHDIHTLTGMFAYLVAALGYAGDSGVILFFLLSGFLLFLPYAKALLFQSSWPSFYRYYLRRVFRILPGYYVTLFLMILIFNQHFLDNINWHDLLLFLTFGMSHALSREVNGPFWTLATEFQFYLLLPIIAWLCSLIVCSGSLQKRLLKLTLCLLVIVAWGLLTRYWGLFLANTSRLDFLIPHPVSLALLPYLYSDTGKYYEVFAVGMLVSLVYTYLQYAPSAESWRIRMHRLSPFLFMMGLVFLFLLSLCYFYFRNLRNVDYDIGGYYANYARYISERSIFSFLDPHIPAMVYSYWLQWQALAYAISYGLCMVALLYGSPKLKRPFEWSVLSWIASISFSFYMWHLPLLGLCTEFVLDNMRQWGRWSPVVQYGALWCWTLIVIVPLSAVLYFWVEKPAIRLGERFIRGFEQ